MSVKLSANDAPIRDKLNTFDRQVAPSERENASDDLGTGFCDVTRRG